MIYTGGVHVRIFNGAVLSTILCQDKTAMVFLFVKVFWNLLNLSIVKISNLNFINMFYRSISFHIVLSENITNRRWIQIMLCKNSIGKGLI
jgi:hypothetical protein